GIVQIPQVILHSLDALDHAPGFAAEYVLEELQRVAQALELDPQRVKRGDRRAGDDRLVGADAREMVRNQGRNDVPHLVRRGRVGWGERARARSGRLQEAVEAGDESGEAWAVQLDNQRRARFQKV